MLCDLGPCFVLSVQVPYYLAKKPARWNTPKHVVLGLCIFGTFPTRFS